jgi:hypothetical protein
MMGSLTAPNIGSKHLKPGNYADEERAFAISNPKLMAGKGVDD